MREGMEFDRQIQLGDSLLREGNYGEALKHIKKSLALSERSVIRSRKLIALDQLGMAYDLNDQAEEAQQVFQVALALALQSSDEKEKAEVLEDFAQFCRRSNKLAAAEILNKKALQIDARVLSASDPAWTDHLAGMGVIYLEQKRYAEAATVLKKSVAIGEKNLRPGQPRSPITLDLADSLELLGRVYLEQKYWKDAEAIFQRVLKMRIDAFGSVNCGVAEEFNNLGLVSYFNDDLDEAEKFYKQAVQASSCSPKDQAEYKLNLGRLYCCQNRFDEAEAVFKNALAMQLNRLPQCANGAASCYDELIQLYERQGLQVKTSLARQDLQKLKSSLNAKKTNTEI